MILLITHYSPDGTAIQSSTAEAVAIRGIETMRALTEIVDQNNRRVCRAMAGGRVEIVLCDTELDMCEVDTRLFQQPITREQMAALNATAAF